MHGHRGVAEITVGTMHPPGAGGRKVLDRLGMVVDFGVIKQLVGGWVNDNWDHTTLLHQDDPLLQLPSDHRDRVFPGRPPYVMPDGRNPTAECMAAVLFERAGEMLNPAGLVVLSVRVWETPTASAEYRREGV